MGSLHFVTGKGGVGKSTVAAALALDLANEGRVLAIELSPPAGLSRLLEVRPARPGEPTPVPGRPSLHVTYFDGETALAEYLRNTVRLGPLLDRVFEHPLYRAFVRSAPGLQELMAIGKVRDELRRWQGLRHRWDAVVVDAGATGHAFEHLRMPAAAAETFRAGLVHREASRIRDLLQDPQRTSVHVVALPEEMPLEEAIRIVDELGELGLPLGQLVINRCREPAPEGLDAHVRTLDGLAPDPPLDQARASMREVISRTLGWLRIQEEGIAELERRTGRSTRRLPLLPAEIFGRHELEVLGAFLEGRSA